LPSRASSKRMLSSFLVAMVPSRDGVVIFS
jgi:hypothetical protein